MAIIDSVDVHESIEPQEQYQPGFTDSDDRHGSYFLDEARIVQKDFRVRISDEGNSEAKKEQSPHVSEHIDFYERRIMRKAIFGNECASQ